MECRRAPAAYRRKARERIVFIVGPTAVGKTRAAGSLAKKLNAEIISCDSMQVYKGMEILTSKPSAALRKIIPHHLIGIVSPDKEYNVSRYYKDVIFKLKELRKKGKVPLIAGGTGLYMSILLDGIFKGRVSRNIRKRLFDEDKAKGPGYLYGRLKGVDPLAAKKIHPNDTKRVVRALEVFEATGKPISYLQKQRKGLTDKYDTRIFCLDMPRDKLYGRIDSRVEKMFKGGAVQEVKRLVKLKLSRTASYAIGIREIKGYLDGAYSLDEAKEMIKRNTRLYAKRQLTWFRKDKRLNWVKIRDKEKPGEIADKIWKELY